MSDLSKTEVWKSAPVPSRCWRWLCWACRADDRKTSQPEAFAAAYAHAVEHHTRAAA